MKRIQRSLWSGLPEDLVVTISERFNLYTDYVRFRSVCKSWYSYLPKKLYHPSHHFPLLILRYYDKKGSNHRNGIFGLAKNNKLHFLRDLPDEFLHNHSCKGSSNGWLIMITLGSSFTPSIYLYNPFTKAKLVLPPIKGFDIQKLVLSSTPLAAFATNSTIDAQFCHLIAAIAINGCQWERKLVFAKYGDEAWTEFKPKSDDSFFKDVLFHGNKLYALQIDLRVYVFHIGADMQIDSSSYCILQQQPELADEYFRSYWWPQKHFVESYLVESSSNDMLMVVRVIESKTVIVRPILDMVWDCGREFKRKTNRFVVFKWEGERWMQLKSLGEEILFIGLSSLSISSHDFPDYRGNCFYFIDSYQACTADPIMMNYDKGVFSLEDDCIKESSLSLQDEDSWIIQFRLPPAWLTAYIQPEDPSKVGSGMLCESLIKKQILERVSNRRV